MSTQLMERQVWPFVAKGGPDDCWLWTGRLSPKGYGVISVGRRNYRVNRLIAEETYGDMTGLVARHTCDVAACCNPAHIIPGKIADNNRDLAERDRVAHGEAHYRAKLTEAQVRAIRWAVGSNADVARWYGVAEETLRMARLGKTWRRVS